MIVSPTNLVSNFIWSWRGVITLNLITIVLFSLYGLYVQPLHIFLEGDNYLDLRTDGYDLQEVLVFFERLGQLGRAFYLRSTIFDTIWPLALAFSGFVTARMTFQRWWLVGIFAIGPVAFGVLDLFENIGLVSMNLIYPDIPNGLVSYSNFMTLIKLTMIPLASAAFIGTPIVAVVLAYLQNKR